MLTKGFKDEDQQKLSEFFYDMLQLDFVPKNWRNQQKISVNVLLKEHTGLSIDTIIATSESDLLTHLHQQQLSFENYELLGDLLLKIIPVETENQTNLANKALAIFEYAQIESKMFSFGLIQKITQAKSFLKS
ncbi:hypothetical protein SAMN05216480_10155 [Pustulibacterium marinum]|uniref:Uncharacterized protein n=1 Tax=Pustulibacterium marinum TaxID=1224947 RepID=A0A1I7ET27_9FLAO|nr:hypothetical protein [Pustulibacterium marinum]SFU27063.1 hypothetical protein SAMN05216480_10155 [Pustulibacterium marinum]